MRIVRTDLHNHLKTGRNMRGLFNKTVDRVRERLGAGGIIGLINFSDRRYEDFSGERGYERVDLGNALYVPEKDALIVKGQEVETKDGHLLVLGLEKDRHLKRNRPLRETIEEASDNGGILVADHPFYASGVGRTLKLDPFCLNELHGIEVHNGEAALYIPGLLPRNANQRAQEYFDRVGELRPYLAAVVSSDGHSIREIGSSWMELLMPSSYSLSMTSAKEVVENLKIGLIENRLKKLDTRRHNSHLGAFAHAASLPFAWGLLKLRKEI